MQSDFAIVTRLLRERANDDMLLKSILHLFENYGLSLELFSGLLVDEINNTIDENTLFRSNSATSKAMTFFSRLVGGDFLRQVLKSNLQEISQLPPLEIDPKRITPEMDVSTSLRVIQNMAQQIFNTIVNSIAAFPAPILALCSIIRKGVEARFPGKYFYGVGGFVFLRFICPAIAAPETHGLVDSASAVFLPLSPSLPLPSPFVPVRCSPAC